MGSPAFELNYIFKPAAFQMSVHTKAEGAILIFPVVSPASETVIHAGDGEWGIKKKSAHIKLTSQKTPEWDNVTGNRVFNFLPGFKAVVVKNTVDINGNAFIRMVIGK